MRCQDTFQGPTPNAYLHVNCKLFSMLSFYFVFLFLFFFLNTFHFSDLLCSLCLSGEIENMSSTCRILRHVWRRGLLFGDKYVYSPRWLSRWQTAGDLKWQWSGLGLGLGLGLGRQIFPVRHSITQQKNSKCIKCQSNFIFTLDQICQKPLLPRTFSLSLSIYIYIDFSTIWQIACWHLLTSHTHTQPKRGEKNGNVTRSTILFPHWYLANWQKGRCQQF